MSSSDPLRAGAVLLSRRAFVAAAATLALGLAAGCTARPLYGELAPAGAAGGPGVGRLAAVDVPPVNNRVGQELRNYLIFMFGGGQGRPAQPDHRLELSTTASQSVSASVNTGRVSLEPTSGIMVVTAAYTLRDAHSGDVVAQGTRSVQAPYDIPAQDFAARRAVRDAENRAARELAELLRLVVAQALER